MKKLIIAIDGPVGSGKSTVAWRVADQMGYTYLDSGAMYRALAWKAVEQGVPLDSEAALEKLAAATRIDLEPQTNGVHVKVDGVDVTTAIRRPEISRAASRLAVLPVVRRVLVAEQQRAGGRGGLVMEGRDIGTVVFPKAELKIFLDATLEVRARRRWKEHKEKRDALTLDQVMDEVRERDRRDREREASPLVRAVDAVVVDNTAMDAEETARVIVLLAREREKAAS